MMYSRHYDLCEAGTEHTWPVKHANPEDVAVVMHAMFVEQVSSLTGMLGGR